MVLWISKYFLEKIHTFRVSNDDDGDIWIFVNVWVKDKMKAYFS